MHLAIGAEVGTECRLADIELTNLRLNPLQPFDMGILKAKQFFQWILQRWGQRNSCLQYNAPCLLHKPQ